MGLTSGTKLGPYEIVSPLGAGGMGEVYRARDTRLDRDVAIKVLPANLSSDPVLRQRLEREAKAVSKLSHPHICTLHDIGHQDGVDFLVMELVLGETLEHKLTKGPLPPDQTLRYAAQIADALAKAHRLGVTHRDLKPSNIMLTKSGTKLMDFGLAKQAEPAPLATASTEMTMEQQRLTSQGMLVGTFQYMAPEQLEGKEADARTDIFALGEVIYEMATGRPAFSGKSRASLIAAILTTEPPPITQLQPITPLALERVVKKCLAKDPDERWQSASDLASELNWILEGGLQAGVPPSAVRKRNIRERMAWAVAALALSAAVMMGVVHLRDTGNPVRVVRSSIPPEEGSSILVTGDYSGPAVLSPDGRGLAFVASREEGPALLWVREVAGLHARALAGTEGATFPFWSADGRSLGFFAGGKLKTISVEGGTPIVLCDAPAGRGGTWGAAGTIVFSPQFQSTLSQVPASGGTSTPATVMDTSKHDSHRWPYFLPDGRHFLYLAVTHDNDASSNDAVYVGSLDGKESHLVMNGMTNVGYARGRLLFMRDASLMAQPFDSATGALRGEAERLAEDVLVDRSIWRAAFDASTSGLLAYTSGGLLTQRAEWYDRSGKPLLVMGEETPDALAVRLSPDGGRLAVGGFLGDVWVHDFNRKVTTRLTFGPGASFSPIWSPDGQWIAYEANRPGKRNLYRKHANGMGQEELLLEGDGAPRLTYDWSPAGDSLLFGIGDFVSTGQIWVLPLLHDRKPALLVKSPSFLGNARFSPDGHWVSYNSNESGRTEVYVVPYGSGVGKWQVSNAGGTQAIWRRDGKELFYVNADSILVSVPVTFKAGGVEFGAVHPLFRVSNPMNNVGLYDPYDVTRDGKRFVIITIPQQASKPITLVTNWMADLKQQ